jgi:hypothetical protein
MSILSLLYRTAGAWGAGKGSNLTPAEVDQNFYDLEQAVETLAANPVLPAEIESAEVTDGDQLKFFLSNGDFTDPVTLPSGKPVWREDWLPETEYVTGDLFRAQDPVTGVTGIYFVNRSFESGLAFDPDLGIGIGGTLPYASFVVAAHDKVRIGWFWPGKPGEGLPEDLLVSDDTPCMFAFLATDTFYIPVDFAGSIAKLRGPSGGDMTFGIGKNNVPFGALNFTAGEADGVFSFTDSPEVDINFAVGDYLELYAPFTGVDATAYGLSVTIAGRLGTAEVDSSS